MMMIWYDSIRREDICSLQYWITIVSEAADGFNMTLASYNNRVVMKGCAELMLGRYGEILREELSAKNCSH